MATKVDICNMALSHLGEAARVASIDPPDGSAEAGYCATFYNVAREELLEDHAWTWAQRRVALVQATNPSEAWAYAYALPSDCKTPVRVLQRRWLDLYYWVPYPVEPTADELAAMTDRGGADFEIEGAVLLTNEPDAVLLYSIDATDTTRFSAKFVSALSYQLAAYLAGPIVKGEPGAKTAGQLREIAARVIGEAAAHDANKSSERAEHMPLHMRR